MKNLLCKLGIHKPDKFSYVTVTRYHKSWRAGKGKKYHRNYEICARCGKRLNTFAKHKNRRLKCNR